jgi:hypothetical protein
VDDAPLRSYWTPEDRAEALVDVRLQTWFQHLLAEPVPARFLALIEGLDSGGGK